MRAFVFTGMVCLALIGAVSAQLPAQKNVPGKGGRPTQPPEGKAAEPEPEKAGAAQLMPRAGGKPKLVAAIADAPFKIGLRAYAGNNGVVVIGPALGKDLNQGKRTRCPVEEIMVDFLGNGKIIKVRLEPGDVITSVDGLVVNTIPQLVVAINAALNPHSMEITFIDWKTGNEYVGRINAMKVK